MSLIAFFVIVLICCVCAWGLCWLLAKLPGTPAFVPIVVWAVACLIILVTLFQALGLYGIDPMIPRLR
jgi:hypothetical protein